QGLTLMMSASWYGNTSVVSLLLQRGADPFLLDVNGRNPLCYAAASGEISVVRVLLGSMEKFQPNYPDPDDPEIDLLSRSPLYYAVATGNHKVLNMLLEAGVSPDSNDIGIDDEGITLLMIAAWLGDFYALNAFNSIDKTLLNKDGGVRDDAGRTALEWSAAAFVRDRNTGREVNCPDRGSHHYPLARLLAGRLRDPLKGLDQAVINAWSPGLNISSRDDADDWRDKKPSPVPTVAGDGDLTLYRIFRDEEPGTPSE
ncbi:MAG: ankyrin repeat domain-containing protein, partial [Spirochaetaceae bacterium]|nr:ankyrin repeat domain-containing protein [Spirochaetaceae bacterium]